jgi:N-carbamoylputrescine amidase
MAKILKVALLQLTSLGSDSADNLLKGEQYCRLAAEQGADIALFPEMWNVGYDFYKPDPPHVDQRDAITKESPFFRHFQTLAQELNIAIGLTYLEKWENYPRNTLSLVDRHGRVVLDYAKVHTCDFGDEAYLTPGDDFYVATLDTAKGTVQIGAMICYDREFPESARILMLKGAEIILTPNACDLEENRLSQFRARAYENMVGLAMANYAAPQQNGHSIAFDGMAFNRNEGSRNMKLIEADEREGIFMAHFDLDALRAYREYETWGNAYRKPRLYGILTAPEVLAPFERPDSRR